MTGQRVVMTDPKDHDYFYEEAIKILRTNIQFTGADIKTVLVTSCYPNEGKSDIVFQLALEVGKMDRRALVLDADIRKSSFISRFQVQEKTVGLSQFLSGQAEKEDIIYRTNFPGVDIIFAGPSAPNPSELLEQDRFADLVRSVRGQYDYVFVDTPPISGMVDAAVAAKQCDGAVLVIESELVSRRTAAKAKEQLEMSGCAILGGVLNKVDAKRDRYYSKYSRYSYYYHGEKK